MSSSTKPIFLAASMRTASSPAFVPLLIATVATGILRCQYEDVSTSAERPLWQERMPQVSQDGTLQCNVDHELGCRAPRLSPPGSSVSHKLPLVGVFMGSHSDPPVMYPAACILNRFQIPYEPTNVSAHCTLDWFVEYVAVRGDRWKRGSHLGMIGILYSSVIR